MHAGIEELHASSGIFKMQSLHLELERCMQADQVAAAAAQLLQPTQYLHAQLLLLLLICMCRS